MQQRGIKTHQTYTQKRPSIGGEMKFFWSNFRTKAYFLPAYLACHMLLSVSLLLILELGFKGGLSQFTTFPVAFLIVTGFLIGIKLPTIMHNCAHENLGFGNLFWGELTASVTLISFGIVCVNHIFHHAHPDTEKDPHTPNDKSFFFYLLTCLHSGVDVIRKGYLKFHGDNMRNRSLYNASVLIHFVSIPLKILVWKALLGTEIFLFFFLPLFLAFIFTFAHVNYITHQKDEHGRNVILNMNSNPWYKFVNLVADGIYFHKNHHINPKLYNPQTLEGRSCNPIGEILRKIRPTF